MEADGRYLGGDEHLSVVVRVDIGGCGVLSADISRADISRADTYLATVRTAPGVPVTGTEGEWPAVWQDVAGATATGTIATAPAGEEPGLLTVTLRCDRPLAGLPAFTDHAVTVSRSGAQLRDLAVEVVPEVGVRTPGSVDFHGSPMDLSACLRTAGFAVVSGDDPIVVPAPADRPWDYSKLFTLLNDLMARTSMDNLSVPAWGLHLLLLSRCSKETLAGVMFDQAPPLPRQGAAVFAERIRDLAKPDDQDRQILRTAVHELGHALNLVHRFEREVDRADSTSFMNYPSRYLRGGHSDEYWQRFAYTFDPDELEFLRHAPRAAIRPGGAPFHSVRYWSDTGGGYVPYLPEVPEDGLRLTLEPPRNGPVFAFGQPVLLGVTLENLGVTPVEFAADPLDPKTGGVEVLIRRATNAGTPAGATRFVPVVQACVLEDESTRLTLAPGGTLRNNLNLTFGSGGFAFAEPGTYEVTPVLGLADGGTERVVVGGALRIRVAYPKDPAEEQDALVLTRADVGTWFVLGGSDCLAAAEDDLMAVYERRRATNGSGDAVAAGIARAAGINAGRDFVRVSDGRYRQRPADPQRAAELLGGLDAAALSNFDPQTAAGTEALTRRYSSTHRRVPPGNRADAG